MKKVQFKFDKMITYFSNEHGANAKNNGESYSGHWGVDISYLDTSAEINDVGEIQGTLEGILKENYLPYDYFAIMDDGIISFNAIEDGESNIVDNDQSIQIEKDGGQLYICDYSVSIEMQEVYEPEVHQLQQMFPNADY